MPRILVVDDDTALAEMIGIVLRSDGFEPVQHFFDAGVEELFQRTREAAQQATGGMSSGIIAPRPDRRCPPWCKLGPACRAQRRGYRP